MTHDDIEIIGKRVKDMYGTSMGKVIGTTTDIDGSVQSVGVDCGSQGLLQIQYDQLVVQEDVVIFIPKWRLDSQRLIREKQLTIRRLKALIDIVSDNDEMKEDAAVIHDKYKSRMASLDEAEAEIKVRLEARLAELEEQKMSARTLLFDARVQFKSDEITETTFGTVKSCTNEVMERISHETAEISNVKSRITDLDLSMQEMILPPPQDIQESAVSYLEKSYAENQQQQAVQVTLPEAPTEPVAAPPSTADRDAGGEAMSSPVPDLPNDIKASTAFPEPPHEMAAPLPPSPPSPSETAPAATASPQQAEEGKDNGGGDTDDADSDWLARMEAQ